MAEVGDAGVEAGPYAGDERLRPGRIGPREQDDELIPAVASRQVHGPRLGPQGLRQRLQRFIAGHARAPAGNRRAPPTQDFVPRLVEIGGAQRAAEDELRANPRARSAVLRVAEKAGGPPHSRATGSRGGERPAMGEPGTLAKRRFASWANAPRAARGRACRAGLVGERHP